MWTLRWPAHLSEASPLDPQTDPWTHSLLNKILDEFTTKVSKDQWEGKARESRASGKQILVDYPSLSDYILKYQDPKQADTIMRVQQELDETKIILVSHLDHRFTGERGDLQGPQVASFGGGHRTFVVVRSNA